MSFVRFDFDSAVALSGRVFFIDDEGNETDISSVVTRIEFDGTVGALNTAKLHVIKVIGQARAEIVDLLVEELGPA